LPVTLAGGQVIHPDEVLGPVRAGISLALTGDVARVDDLVESVRGVDLLVCEATYLERDADLARHFGHLTAAKAAWLARETGARRLMLNHISQRYRIREILEEARAIFRETFVARDFDHLRITRERIELLNQELQHDETLKSPRPPVRAS